MSTQETNYSQLILQYVRRHNVLRFTRQQLLNDDEFMTQLATISSSKTLDRASDFLLQQLRDNDLIRFMDYDGTYEVVTTLR